MFVIGELLCVKFGLVSPALFDTTEVNCVLDILYILSRDLFLFFLFSTVLLCDYIANIFLSYSVKCQVESFVNDVFSTDGGC